MKAQILFPALLGLLVLATPARAETPVADIPQRVQAFIAAGNAQDVDAMVRATAPGLRSMSVAHAKLTVEVSRHHERRNRLHGYLIPPPEARSSMDRLTA